MPDRVSNTKQGDHEQAMSPYERLLTKMAIPPLVSLFSKNDTHAQTVEFAPVPFCAAGDSITITETIVGS